MNCLIKGVRKAAKANVQILVIPETSLTGLRISDNLMNRRYIQSELTRFQKVVSKIRNAPYVLVRYPEWISKKHPETILAVPDDLTIKIQHILNTPGWKTFLQRQRFDYGMQPAAIP